MGRYAGQPGAARPHPGGGEHHRQGTTVDHRHVHRPVRGDAEKPRRRRVAALARFLDIGQNIKLAVAGQESGAGEKQRLV